MKKPYILLIALLLVNGVKGQSTKPCVTCLPQGITFSTQAQIDNFQTTYPGCTQIQGTVEIHGSGITNLSGLNILTSIGSNGEDLVIGENDILNDLTGLNSLITIGGSLRIGGNNVLLNLSGLNSLTSISGNLMMWSNPLLDSLTGLENLTFIGGDLDIGVPGQAHPFGSPSLISLTGLNALTSIGGTLYISLNYALTNLMALENLTSIGRFIVIEENDVLNSLNGLDNINATTIEHLAIVNNTSLSNCAVQSICNIIANPNSTIDIHNNTTGCNSQAEVDTACKTLSVENLTFDDEFSIYPTPSSTQITIETSVTPNQCKLSIMNLNGRELITFKITEPKTQINISVLPSGVYFVRLTGERMVQVEKFIKQ